jgi:8-oxo-dGTP diphosphatase
VEFAGRAHAAVREVREETGLVVDIHGLVDVHDVILRNKERVLTAHYVLSVFWGRCAEGAPCAATDVVQAQFVPLDEIDGYRMTPGAQGIIRRAFELSRQRAAT